MKITIDIDCSPQEARAFLGLPEVGAMQEALVTQMQERLAKALETSDPEALMRLWLPAGLEGFTQLQEQFWQQMTAMAPDKKPKG
jgi:hypothetical protein